MNKQCLKCSQIMLVPDIPLPKSYTQKCTKCGFDNPVGDELFFDRDDPSDSDDMFELGSSLSESIDLSSGGINRDNADEWMSKLQTAPPPSTPSDRPAPTLSATQISKIKYEIESKLKESFKKELMDEWNATLEHKLAELEIRMRSSMDAVPARAPEPPVVQTPQEEEDESGLVALGEALVCTQNAGILHSCQGSLHAENIHVHQASTVAEAKQRIQEYAYQVIIFDQRFVQSSPEGQGLLTCIRQIALPIRRHQSVLLITPGIPSVESQAFYQWGVDMNIHPDEIPHIGSFTKDLIKLKKSMLGPYLNSELDTDRVMM